MMAESAKGWLAITLAPGKKTMGTDVRWHRDLAADLDELVRLGATTLVPLLEDSELRALDIALIVEEAKLRGLQVERFPFHDGGVPKEPRATQQFVDQLVARVHDGARVVVHCNGGLGRAGTIAACVRLRMGLDADAATAIASVRERRSHRAIETRAQEAFIAEYAGCMIRTSSPPARLTREARVKGAWYGLVVGDVLGAPVEFKSAEAIARDHGVWQEVRAGGMWEQGEWTDDTALALCNVAAYRDATFDTQEAASEMLRWYATKPKDIGKLTRAALRILADNKVSPEEAGPLALAKHPNSAGNGSLMRAAPTGLVRDRTDERIVKESARLSLITHADERCVDACIAFNLVLAALASGETVDEALGHAVQALTGRNADVADVVARIAAGKNAQFTNAQGIGFVLLCLEWALEAVRDSESFEVGLIRVVNRGGDTDTNGAVAGALLGARFGFDAIPERWLARVQKRSTIDAAYQTLANYQ